MALVEIFVQKTLTFESDILNAFSGILDALQQAHFGRTPTDFVCGLPTFPPENDSTKKLPIPLKGGVSTSQAEFGQLLLWRPLQKLRRREIREDKDDLRSTITPFPSWSWAGWIGEITYGPNSPHYLDRIIDPGIDKFVAVSLDPSTMAGNQAGSNISKSIKARVESSTGMDLDVLTRNSFHRNGFYALRITSRLVLWDNFSHLSVETYSDSSDVTPMTKLYDSNGKVCGLIHEGVENLPPSITKDLYLIEIVQRAFQAEDHRLWSTFSPTASHFFPIWVEFLLIRVMDNKVAERIGVGKLEKDSWDAAGPRKKEIYLI
jgi:hypothetical protein